MDFSAFMILSMQKCLYHHWQKCSLKPGQTLHHVSLKVAAVPLDDFALRMATLMQNSLVFGILNGMM